MGYDSHAFSNPEAKLQRQARQARRQEQGDRRAEQLAQQHPEQVASDTDSDSESRGVHDECMRIIGDLRHQVKTRDDVIVHLRERVDTLETRVREASFGASVLSTPASPKVADARTRFLTGSMTLGAFTFFCGFLKDRCESLAKCALGVEDAVLMVMMKVRLNFPNHYLALRFGVSASYVSRLIRGLLPEMAQALSFLVQWPSRDDAMRTMPKQVKRRYGCFVRGIIDCTEIVVKLKYCC